MGRLVDGQWLKTSIIRSDKNGAYDRIPRSFRDTIDKNHPVFQPESGRYHLYVSYACPWANRALMLLKLKGLEEHISVNVVHPDMLDMGWSFDTDFDGATGDTLYGYEHLKELYTLAAPDISTSVTVPVLWDKKTKQIVNNESSEIIRIFNTAFNELTGNEDDYYPKELRAQIDTWNELIYDNINNGVYRCGFAKTQQAYDDAATKLFDALDKLEAHFEAHVYLVDDRLTEADIRLIPTLLRFDLVYYIHFKCSKKRIADYKNLSEYVKRMFEIPAVSETTDFEHIKRHYYYSHQELNPSRIVPLIDGLSCI